MNAGISRRIKRLMTASGQNELKHFFVNPITGGGWGEYITGIKADTKEKCLALVSEYIDRKRIENSITFIDDLTEDLELFARE